MSLLRANIDPSPRELRVFGLIWLVFFAGAAGVLAYRGMPLPLVVISAILAVAVPGVGWVFPALLRVVFIGLSYLTYPVGLVVSTVLLLALYYLVFTPMGLLARLFGYDPMGRRFESKARTYWQPRQPRKGLARYFRQS